eukprot:scaffold56866_cov73-Phaeocystis_antarctica.AAC.2
MAGDCSKQCLRRHHRQRDGHNHKGDVAALALCEPRRWLGVTSLESAAAALIIAASPKPTWWRLGLGLGLGLWGWGWGWGRGWN